MTTVVIAGGTGNAGARLAERLGARFTVRQLGSGTNLLSLPDTEAALAGAQIGVYLARATRTHSRLTQAKREDLELLMADTFARAAARCGLRRLIAWPCADPDERRIALAAAGLPLTLVAAAEEIDAALAAEPISAAPGATVLAPRRGRNGAVCSVQRLPLPAGWTAEQAMRAYFDWSHAHLLGVSSQCTGDAWTLRALGAPMLCLSMVKGRSAPEVASLAAGGGWLCGSVAGSAHFEFRAVPTASGPALFISLTGFLPALPWPIYRVTQAPVHGWVMSRFGKWLARR